MSVSPRLGIVQINVTDRAKALHFYRDALGLEVKEPHGSNGPFEVEVPGAPTILVYSADRLAESAYETQRITLTFYTDRLEETIRTWNGRGVEFAPISWSKEQSGIADCPYGRFIAFKDPFGNVFELLQPSR